MSALCIDAKCGFSCLLVVLTRTDIVLTRNAEQREAQVLELRFGLSGDVPMTLEDIGKLFSVTR
jgi:DNA-directed RNA polymerase sigma subunit (sigma70/sigma32)